MTRAHPGNFHFYLSGSDLDAQFKRTRLPRSALARYLGVENPAVSKMLRDARKLKGDEVAAVAAFFSIMPPRANHLLQAVSKLRSKQVRDRAGRALAQWASRRASRPVADLLSLAEQGDPLAADQIVALCRSDELDLPTLVATGKVRREDGAADDLSKPPFVNIDEAARQWAEEAGAPQAYRLDPRAEVTTTIAHARSVQEAGSVLHRADNRFPDPRSLESYFVTDDTASPRFEQGDMIFLDEPRRATRNGDLVAVVLGAENGGVLRAVIGRLLFHTRHITAVRQPRGGRRDIAKEDIRDIRRIACCVF
jgi:hypothetical protein